MTLRSRRNAVRILYASASWHGDLRLHHRVELSVVLLKVGIVPIEAHDVLGDVEQSVREFVSFDRKVLKVGCSAANYRCRSRFGVAKGIRDSMGSERILEEARVSNRNLA